MDTKLADWGIRYVQAFSVTLIIFHTFIFANSTSRLFRGFFVLEARLQR